MSYVRVLTCSVFMAIESVIIITGNIFTIFVFWTQRLRLKRPALLLINLAVADLLVGLAKILSFATEMIPNLLTGNFLEALSYSSPSSGFVVLSSCASMFCLAEISLERAYAVTRPLSHRVASLRSYICAVAVAWIAAVFMATLFTLAKLQIFGTTFMAVTINTALASSLVIIFVAYLTLKYRLSSTVHDIQSHNRKTTEQTLKLARTLSTVICLSLVCWLPTILVFIILEFCTRCFPSTILCVSTVMYMANSIVNPIVYSYRMPIFKEALKRCAGGSNHRPRTLQAEVKLSSCKCLQREDQI